MKSTKAIKVPFRGKLCLEMTVRRQNVWGGEVKEKKKQTAKQTGIRGSNLCCLWSVSFTHFHTSLDSPDNFTQDDDKINQIKNRPLDLEGEPISRCEWLKSAML